MKKNLILLLVLLVVLVVMFAGCGTPANSVNGLWYDVNGFGTMEFKSGGVVTANVMGMSFDGTYTFDAAKGEGTITLMEDESTFTLKDGKIDAGDSTFTREKVEQQDLSDLMNGLGDALASPGN